MTLDEMDKLAGELIMGWECTAPYGFYKNSGSPSRSTNNWQPTHNIAHAFELLEKMNHAWQIKSLPFTNSYICCVMTIDINIFGQAGTVPLAITLACLKARGVNCD